MKRGKRARTRNGSLAANAAKGRAAYAEMRRRGLHHWAKAKARATRIASTRRAYARRVMERARHDPVHYLAQPHRGRHGRRVTLERLALMDNAQIAEWLARDLSLPRLRRALDLLIRSADVVVPAPATSPIHLPQVLMVGIR